MTRRNTTEASVVAIATADNMSPVQKAAFRLLYGTEEAQAGSVDLSLALVPLLDRPLFYTFEEKRYTFCPAQYLETPRKLNAKNESVKDNAHQRARWIAYCDLLGLDVERAEKIKSNVVKATRAALGMKAQQEKRGHSFERSEAGNLLVPASVAFDLVNDKGEPTAQGKAAYDAAKSKLQAKAEAMAEITGSAVEAPEESAIWGLAAALPVECSGAKQKQGEPPVSIFGDLPTNSHTLQRLEKIAVETGYAPAVDTRQGQTPDADNSPIAKATALLVKALTPDSEGLLSVAFSSSQLAQLSKLRALIVELEEIELVVSLEEDKSED